MADDEVPSESLVIAALNDLYGSVLTATEQIRRLKVRMKVRYRYCRLVEELACILHCHCCACKYKHPEHAERDKHSCGHCLVCWSFATLHRIEHLGGDADSKLGDVTTTSFAKTCLQFTLASLQDVFDKAGAVIDAADKDRPTAKVAGEIQCAADNHIECIQAHLRQANEMGISYLTTIV